MPVKSEPNLRDATIARFGEEWARALEQGAELQRTFERLTETLHALAEHGAHQTLVMPEDLLQEWWVTFQEAHGEMVPRNPATPPRMQHEDEIVAERAAVA
jgi:hypothetical protein